MSETKGSPWRIPPERAKTQAELRSTARAASGGSEGSSSAAESPPMATMRIGEVADRLGLSLRSIRYYEESGLVTPSARTQGGFRLYTEPDVSRLLLIMQMKPLGFSLEEMREVFASLDALDLAGGQGPAGAEAAAKLTSVLVDVEERLELLRTRMGIAESFGEYLRTELAESEATEHAPGTT